jgi:hypothetical protein
VRIPVLQQEIRVLESRPLRAPSGSGTQRPAGLDQQAD